MNREEDLEWELRPGGMLVQKREDGDNNVGLVVVILGDLKKRLVQETGFGAQGPKTLVQGKGDR
ncbi:hypothetical protein CK203_094036 [Vitis vinifera]|uniref:Uncharacterized protein n=1 Tax=Vitis vinifera TaxID=29760 RepID=A0A438BRT7_VITVI|nr:hypothetical protein CK203_094036 [Vitis vinifera]